MMIVVADTSPINYLLLIGQIDVLARIYQGVIVPRAVFDELTSAGAPIIVRDWLSKKPVWLSVSDSIITPDQSLDYLGRGERDAIALAQLLQADRLIVDESAARREAARRGIPIIGLLGVLLEASRRDLLDLPKALENLKSTSFHVSEELICVCSKLIAADSADLRRALLLVARVVGRRVRLSTANMTSSLYPRTPT